MSDISSLKALSPETKALIFSSEFALKRAPISQLRTVLELIVSSSEERKQIQELLEGQLRSQQIPPDDIAKYLAELFGAPNRVATKDRVLGTRKVRSPFAMRFEANPPPAPPPSPSGSAARGTPAAVPGDGQNPAPVQPAAASGSRQEIAAAVRKTGRQRTGKTLVFKALPEDAAKPKPAGPPIVVIADDDENMRKLLKIRLSAAGYVVAECKNGTEAWERIRQGDASLAVLDMKMPGLHGLEVLALILENRISIPVVVCSAHDHLADEVVIQKHPKLKYLVKASTSMDAIVSTVNDFLTKA